MIASLKETQLYKSLNLAPTHAYLFYSLDKDLNNELALNFAGTFFCEKGSNCGKCNQCKQFLNLSHPDFVLINQDSVKVEDINKLTDKLNTKPVLSAKKVILILNAEVINEISQNKLLKSLEEPNESIVFILTTSKMDKLLPTIQSRLKKIEVPKITSADKLLISEELKQNGINITDYINNDFNLTECLNLNENSNYLQTINTIFVMLNNLNTSKDIPAVISNMGEVDKSIFFSCLQDIFLNALKGNKKFDEEEITKVKLKFSQKAIIKILPIIEQSFKYMNSNVNFTYILDILLFNILKEKYLCN